MHPRLEKLRAAVASLPIDDGYRQQLYRSVDAYAEQILGRPEIGSDEGWDDLEALQQVTLGDMMEASLRRCRYEAIRGPHAVKRR